MPARQPLTNARPGSGGAVLDQDLVQILGEFARTMVTDFPIQGILDRLVGRIVDVLPVTAAGVTLIGPDLGPQYVAASNPSALRYEKLQTELGEGPCLAAYGSDEAISVPDLRVDHRFPTFTPQALESGLTAVFTFPLRHEEFRLGALDLYRDTVGPLSPQSMAAAQILADVAAAYLINARARSDLQDSSDRSREAALHDPLTGLPNRVLMLELLEHAFRAARRSGNPSAVFFLDLDRFKQVNDTYGHQVGDALLVAVAQRLTGALRPGDSLARLSGDEFVVLCPDLADQSAADPIAARLDGELCRPFALSGVEVTITASIGIAFTGRGIDEPGELLRDADLAMYRAKQNRVGNHEILDLRELHLARHQASPVRGLSGAIGRDELHLDYQPIVDTADGRLIGVEALLRWTHPTRGVVSPTVFIPFAEQSGQIVELGEWVLQQAWSDRQRFQRQQPAPIGISVNISTHQLMSAGFAQVVAGVLDSTPADPGLLTLEMTETVLVHDDQRAMVVLAELKELGVQVALDDFGTGYSSLGYLEHLPIDSIKIDRHFIAHLSADPGSQVIVSAIIQMAHGLGIAIVAEGVETAQQHETVTNLGSDACQGFYFAKPMLATNIDALIRGRPRPPAAARRPDAEVFAMPIDVRGDPLLGNDSRRATNRHDRHHQA
jgi:diguanylate cyclase (GGDEF)-like protein